MPDISLADQSANRIRKLIEQGRFKPGAHLNIDLLAKEFGVSQTPVREALKKLIHEGLVVYRPKVGYSVRNLTLHEYLQVCELLQTLECHLVRELAKTPFAVDIEGLRAVNAEFAACLPRGDRRAVGRVNDRFHEKLYENYPNKIMMEHLNSLWRGARAPRDYMYDNKLFAGRIAAEHEAIISAIERGDPASAEAAMNAHYVSGRESAITSFPVEA
ncbi:GntR family transcriptional regulator [Synergistes jonesii]|uniref:HTH gntR-type domain-containing protein n=1 Tax=Synergistes jonesii TaxID=2754 RepID=A0A073INP6_9BACT|nr:GntR family transcriptional regulator [Synergistes jonesii]KEJ91200.1 hypothetical protein EH55_11650 [Synergistes jonesii]OFB60301.1 hypothetical protein JS73_12480 [Synergistes jonesii]OFB65672.1 hypothetical protein JS72_01575 [Synergistes jonesii]OFB66166.1 hypothetical protein JS79_03265 [Synergistes jonesii]OFB66501.1 hypothetical protein JS78_12500 [Synergistes jonesii]